MAIAAAIDAVLMLVVTGLIALIRQATAGTDRERGHASLDFGVPGGPLPDR
jgi:hypothetical protein